MHDTVEPVDPLDADAAISDIQGIIRHNGMSTTDLAVELGWKRSRVENFLYGVEIPSREDFIAVAKELQYDLEF